MNKLIFPVLRLARDSDCSYLSFCYETFFSHFLLPSNCFFSPYIYYFLIFTHTENKNAIIYNGSYSVPFCLWHMCTCTLTQCRFSFYCPFLLSCTPALLGESPRHSRARWGMQSFQKAPGMPWGSPFLAGHAQSTSPWRGPGGILTRVKQLKCTSALKFFQLPSIEHWLWRKLILSAYL